MKIFSVERKVALLMFFLVLIVGAAGYLTYQSLTYVLTAIKKEAKPNLTLVLIKEVNSSITRCESNLKYFSLTGQEKYLKYYRNLLGTVDKGIVQLYWYNQGNPVRKKQIDTLNWYIQEKSVVWEKMLGLRNNNRVGEALTQLERKLDSVGDTIKIKLPASVKVARTDSVKIKKQSENDDESEGGFFSRLFRRKSEDKKENASSEPSEMNLLEEPIAEKDTNLGVGINRSLLQQQIRQIRKSEVDTFRKQNAQEISLVKRSEYLSQRINQLVLKIERLELSSITEKAAEADSLVEKTNKWMIVFLIGFANILIAVFYVIAHYVRKTNAIQEALVHSKEEALQLSRAKEVFMANMSHEIRTPMNAIVGFSEQIIQTQHDFHTKEQLTIIKKSADHLLRIINDILDLSKLEAGKLVIEEEAFRPNVVINDVVQLYKSVCGQKGLELECNLPENLPEVIVGDSFRLKQILLNLVSNAVKFTNTGKIILNIDLVYLTETEISLAVSVADTGIGIEENQLELIFDEFRQADTSTTRRFGGTGLGLSIVKKLIELQNGKLTVKSKPGEGTEFIFTLIYKIGKKEDLKTTENKTFNTSLLKDFSFLVADDDEYNRKLIAHILNKWKVKFKLVTNGRELLEEFENNPFDIILMDIRMPEIDGIQATEIIRNNKQNPQNEIPIIALTATIANGDIERCNEVGIESIIQKPFKEEILLGKVLTALKIGDISQEDVSQETSETEKKSKSPAKFENLFRLANNDEHFVLEMLDMFVKTTNEGLANIELAVKENNLLAIAENSHKIKSPCKHLGANELAELLKEIETFARNGSSVQDIELLLEKANSDIRGLIQEVNDYISQSTLKLGTDKK
jgi:signal transduction histidine kinase/DNA-binding response OmpR family regulator/CHASE3 domain sensor protein